MKVTAELRTACTPRPPVTITSQRGAAGTLLVTVGVARSSVVPNNAVQQLQFQSAQNASVEVNGQLHPGGNFTQTLPGDAQTVQFTVHRLTAGQASTVPFTVQDGCAQPWQTFVGGGSAAF